MIKINIQGEFMIAEFLNTAFASFDYTILSAFHGLATAAEVVFTPIAEIFALIGDNGYFSFLLAFILLCFKKTRKCGICIIFAIGFGALLTNVAIKNIVARPRPYASDIAAFKEWWTYAGAHLESEFSFPSGHTTAAMASMTALCAAIGKQRKWLIAPATLYVIVMGASRNYLMVHYPTDVIAGIIVGATGAIAACFTVNALWKLIEKHSDKRLFAFAIEFDITSIFKRNKKEM